jgi:hypothetical protein
LSLALEDQLEPLSSNAMLLRAAPSWVRALTSDGAAREDSMLKKSQAFAWLALLLLSVGCDDEPRAGEMVEARTAEQTPSSECRRECTQDPALQQSRICEERESYPNYEDTLAEWSVERCAATVQWVVEGECPDGNRLLYYGQGTGVEWRVFGPDGKFVALEVSDEVGADENGCLRTFWPKPLGCEGAQVTRIVCGSSAPKPEWGSIRSSAPSQGN